MMSSNPTPVQESPSTIPPTTQFDFTDHSHRRYNPLSDTWVLCSPHRAKRPWLGQQESLAPDTRPPYDPKCYLCPANTRANGEQNPQYEATYVFGNDFPAVKRDQPRYEGEVLVKAMGLGKDKKALSLAQNLLKVDGVRGTCRVVCFSPKHNVTMAEMTQQEIISVINTWTTEYQSLGQLEYVNYVQIFENKGAIMGCSNPHPHGQVWATESVPEEPAKEIESMIKYAQENNGDCLLCDYVTLETTESDSRNAKESRIVVENESFICVVPFWAVWPYETLILSKRHLKSLVEFTEKDKADLADIMQRITCKYDNIFDCSFPYSMGLHQAPTNGDAGQGEVCHFHMHFYPPLLRSPTVKKFLVGFEMLGEPQRDLTAEQAAERLRNCADVHYKKRQS